MTHRFVYGILIGLFLISSQLLAESKLMTQGDEAWGEGKSSQALKYYHQAYKEASSSQAKAEALYKKGMVYYNMEAWGAAVEAFEAALALHPQGLEQDLNYYIGMSLYGNKNFSESERYFNKAEELKIAPITTWKARLMKRRASELEPKRFSMPMGTGYFYDSNVVLETDAGTRYDTAVSDKMGHNWNISMAPSYSFDLWRTSKLLLSQHLLGNRYLNSNVKGNYDSLASSTGVHLSVPSELWGRAFRWGQGLSYQTAFTRESSNSWALDQVHNTYGYDTAFSFTSTKETYSTFAFDMSRISFKEFSRGHVTSRDGIDYGWSFIKGFSLFGTPLSNHYRYVEGRRTGKQYRYRMGATGINTSLSSFWETTLHVGGSLYYKNYHNYSGELSEKGGALNLSLFKMVGKDTGWSLSGLYARTISDPSIQSYVRLGAGTNLYYFF